MKTDLGGNSDGGGEGDGKEGEGVHSPHEPSLGQPEQRVCCHVLVKVLVEPVLKIAVRKIEKGDIYRALKTSSLPNPLMMVTPDMEEVMWWMTGDFSMLSSFLASRMPEFMVKSSSRKSRKMITKPTRK